MRAWRSAVRHQEGPAVEFQIVFGAHLLVDPGMFQQGPGAGANLIGLGLGIEPQNLCHSGSGFQQTQQ